MCHGKFIPQLLLPEQKGHQLNNDLIQTATSELDFLKKVITGGDLWLYSYDLESKAQWKSPGSPGPKRVQQSRSKIETMLTVFFDWGGGVHHKHSPLGQTIRSAALQCSLLAEQCNMMKTAAAIGNW